MPRRGTPLTNSWTDREKHQRCRSGGEAYRALATIAGSLAAVSAPQVARLAKVKGDLLRQKWDAQTRDRARRAGAEGTAPSKGIRPVWLPDLLDGSRSPVDPGPMQAV